ncbi:phosphoribosylaminoimidazolesuccinocarboxamide synthase [Longibacter salinarum]|uniref:Phosphoribosylaminoimidazole-succinocarboxamide synthase n=1 Tax=Longibacter salinarum TaxID=1850348 RepID=A0A2A8D277_9BACT|nr:phosphoribosylaminoimidazolesuccinocarboxamide synthase [Longibacter salinarum]PEN15059.1 phosphoribosylaminoimidazolesuccinocarboxamide synthase [Longibacter salinarum]
MDAERIHAFLDHTLERTHFDSLGTRYEGKVRDTYRQGEDLVLITTDRISSFDHILKQTIPFKGQILNQTAAFFFEATKDLVPNHVKQVPDPNVTVATACDPLPIEFVMRGYLAGQAWRLYDAGNREISGQPFPDGLRQNSRLPEPVLTPATKAEEGHDENISRDEAIERGLIDAETFDTCAEYARTLYDRGAEMAAERDLILVDTKYEFGRTSDGSIVLIDEVHTPDCSRYFYADGYEERLEANEPQRQLSKEFVRDWLRDNGFTGQPGQTMPDLPDELRVRVTERYVELYEQLTATTFEPDLHTDPVERIREALSIA